MQTCAYEPIGDYAIIGNCQSAALVSREGSIDWLCLPHFSSPSLFGALLDCKVGGRFRLRPRDIVSVERRYLQDTAVLETVFVCATGVLRLRDFMPVQERSASMLLIRMAQCTRGEVSFDVLFQPRPDYARGKSDWVQIDGGLWVDQSDERRTKLCTDLSLRAVEGASLELEDCRLAQGERRFLSLRHDEDVDAPWASPEELFVDTVEWWRAWCGQCEAMGPYSAAIKRSCLTLKLLTHRQTGAVMAAATTSLPESMEADRNWDYRFCWLRDTSLLLQSFLDMGFTDEADAFLSWLLRVSRAQQLEPLYELDGTPVPEEVVLPHLEGYRGRWPVRIGNSACRQLQLDIYGELIHTAYVFARRGGILEAPEKQLLVFLGEVVLRLWREPDQSIWEVRGPPRHHTYSKLMCWVALDRLLKMADTLSLSIDKALFAGEREAIRQSIETHGFDRQSGAYVGYYGGREADASLLLLARYGFVPANDERMLGTYRLIRRQLAQGRFLYRYPQRQGYDHVEGSENLFAVCSFWEVGYLARAGRLAEAIELFELLLGLANDVGLYAEQFAVHDGQPMGNFPQAFSHSGLVTAALAIEQAKSGKRGQQID